MILRWVSIPATLSLFPFWLAPLHFSVARHHRTQQCYQQCKLPRLPASETSCSNGKEGYAELPHHITPGVGFE